MLPSSDFWSFVLPLAGLALGTIVGWLICLMVMRPRLDRLRVELAHQQDVTLLEQSKSQWLASSMEQMKTTFDNLASKSLQSNADEFLKRASERVDSLVGQVRSDWSTQKAEFAGVVTPLRDNLTALDQHVRELEKRREGAYQGVQEQLRQVAQLQTTLQTTTSTLAQALRAPNVRGRWGELQLRRIVELAGMVKHVHFAEQSVTDGGRPDVITYLPNDGIVPIDAKAPLTAYLEATEAVDEGIRRTKLNDHVRAIRTHIGELSKKQYWEQFQSAPDFVVMFVPNEACLHVAFEHDPNLLEHAMSKNVLIASPITLLALLRTIAYGWQQHQMTHNAQQIAEQGRELHKRTAKFVDHFIEMRTSLERSVNAFNKAVGSFDARVIPTIRRLEELGVATTVIDPPGPIGAQIRILSAEKRNNED
ncbi:MAG TPA: DNA recombination protein RmuC [Caldilineaceae bacterium]|nr:DNA recombination protein RmuC [Caldilineaceae bacterium]